MPTINPIIQHKAGLVQCYRAGSVLAIAVFFACPFIARLAPSGAAYVWTALIGAGNTLFWEPVYAKQRSIYQDRLGTYKHGGKGR